MPAGVGDGGTGVGVADGTKLGVMGGTGEAVGTTGADVAGGDEDSLVGGGPVSGTTWLLAGAVCSSVGGRGVSVGAGGASVSATGDSATAITSAGDC